MIRITAQLDSHQGSFIKTATRPVCDLDIYLISHVCACSEDIRTCCNKSAGREEQRATKSKPLRRDPAKTTPSVFLSKDVTHLARAKHVPLQTVCVFPCTPQQLTLSPVLSPPPPPGLMPCEAGIDWLGAFGPRVCGGVGAEEEVWFGHDVEHDSPVGLVPAQILLVC
eukprot:3913992-Rhodomonas_salina.2